MRERRGLAALFVLLAVMATTWFTQLPAEASTGGCTSSDWTGHSFSIGVCINDRGTTTAAFPDIYVNQSPYGNTAPNSSCSILIEVWDDASHNLSHDNIGCAKGHYNGYATPVFGRTSVHAFARLQVGGQSIGTKDSPSITLAATGRVLYTDDYVVTAHGFRGLTIPIHGHASDAFAALHRCFNCNFPISNAPAAYPADDQYVALNGCPGWVSGLCSTWGWLNAPVRFFSAQQNDYLMIVAQPGHFDTAGSTLRWRFWTDSSGLLHLEAKTWNLGDSIPDAANIAGAATAWSAYAAQLGANLYTYCGSSVCS